MTAILIRQTKNGPRYDRVSQHDLDELVSNGKAERIKHNVYRALDQHTQRMDDPRSPLYHTRIMEPSPVADEQHTSSKPPTKRKRGRPRKTQGQS